MNRRTHALLAAAATAASLAPATAHADDASPWNSFEVAGTKIAGTTSPQDAPRLRVGSYTDDVPLNPSARYYRITRTPGSELFVSITARPAETSSGAGESWTYEVSRLDGGSCDSASATRSTGSGGFNLLVGDVLDVESDDTDCGTATDLVLTIKRTTGAPAPAATEIRVIEVPSVANIDSLPPAETQTPPKLRPPVQEAKDVTGGAGFASATEVGTGTFVTKALPGQMVFFKTHLDDGQRITYAIDGPTHDFTAWPRDSASMQIRAQAYNPFRVGLASSTEASYRKDDLADDQIIAAPTVRYRNREASSSELKWAHVAGDYYYGIVVGRSGATKGVTTPVPVKFSVRVDGAAAGTPSYVKGVVGTPSAGSSASGGAAPTSHEAADAPDTAAKAGTTSSTAAGGLPAGVWIGLGVAGLAALGALAYAITRRLAGPRA